MKISTLLYHVDHGSLALPCFAREYVWKPSQVIRLFDSLYRGYPVGGFVFWAPSTATTSRPPEPVMHAQSVELIVDGQQRIAAIYGVMRGQRPGFLDDKQWQPCPLCFHIQNAVFDFYRPDMKDDPHWIIISGLFNREKNGAGKTLDDLYQTPAGPTRIGEYSQKLYRLHGILDRNLHVEYLPCDISPEEVGEIYLVANGGSGRK